MGTGGGIFLASVESGEWASSVFEASEAAGVILEASEREGWMGDCLYATVA